MSSFTTPLILEFVNEERWILKKEFSYRVGGENSQMEINVPVGFITDFASIPRVLWIILTPYGIYGKAAVLHDFLYATQSSTRKWCDQIFLEAMKVLNVSFLKRRTMYRAVRLFGWRSWNKHAKNKSKQSTSSGEKVEKVDGGGLQPREDGLPIDSAGGA